MKIGPSVCSCYLSGFSSKRQTHFVSVGELTVLRWDLFYEFA